MIATTLVLLHVGHGAELTLLEYLFRVLLHLIIVGTILVLVVWWSNVLESVRSVFSTERGIEADDR